MVGKLLDDTECQVLLDTGANTSFMSKSYYLGCKSLCLLPKFASKTQRIQVGNGQYINVLFNMPIVIDIYGHRFEIFTLVSEIHKNDCINNIFSHTIPKARKSGSTRLA